MELDEKQYRMIVESAPNMVWRAGVDSLCDYFNRTWLEFTGRSMEQELGNGWAEGVHPDDLERCIRIFLDNFNKRKAFEMEYRLMRADGQWRWVNDRGVPFFHEDGTFAGYIGSCIDVTERVEAEKIKWMAQMDGLTGVYNRQYFAELARNELEKAERYKTEACVVLLDLDGFKQINDRFGHLAGDEVLKHFAGTMKANLRKFDLMGRYGGDEFILLMPQTGPEVAGQALNRITQACSVPFRMEGGLKMAVGFSYGIASSLEDASFEKLISLADRRMYRMKNA